MLAGSLGMHSWADADGELLDCSLEHFVIQSNPMGS